MDRSRVSLSRSFLHGFAGDPRPAARLERVLAVGRAFLSVAGLIAIYFDPTEPRQYAGVTYALLFAYAVWALGVLVVVHAAPRMLPRHALTLHAVDVLWTSILTFISAGPVSPFFLFFLFTVVAAAYRWGFRETVWTTAFVLLVVTLQLLAFAGPWTRAYFATTQVEVNRTVIRFAYLVLTGFLVGYLAEQEKQFRLEIAAVAQASRHTRVDAGLGGAVTSLAGELIHLLGASGAAVVMQDQQAPAAELWRVPGNLRPNAGPAQHTPLTSAETKAWLFDDAGHAWHAPLAERGPLDARATEAGNWPLLRVALDVPDQIRDAGATRSLTAVNVGLAGEWRGRIYLFDLPRTIPLERPLHFLDALTDQLTSALTNMFLMRRLRSQVTAAERARVARELHDGAIQALFGIEMKLEAMRRNGIKDPAQALKDLEGIQDLVQREVLELRELMQALKPIQLESTEQLSDVLASVVERFRRDTGVSARYVAQGTTPVSLHPGTALELVRIVQEALVNVRKHSRARNVLVRLSRDHGHAQLVIEDDGEGFGFEGRLTAEELDARRIGPAIIKERARVVGGALTVESTPGVGSRVELTLTDEI